MANGAIQSIGVHRIWTTEFVCLREQQSRTSSSSAKVNADLDIDFELARILSGYHNSISKSVLRRTMSSVTSPFSLPVWQKGKFYAHESLRGKCSNCEKTFGVTTKRLHCVICGKALCGSCHKEELLVYQTSDNDINVCLIYVVGSPEKEPDCCEYLPVCSVCHSIIRTQQIERCKVSVPEAESGYDILLRRYLTFSDIENKIDEGLTKLQEAVQIFHGAISPNVANQNVSIKTIARYHCDVGDLVAKHRSEFHAIEKHRTDKGDCVRLWCNFKTAKNDFYNDRIFRFRTMQTNLDNSAPVSSLSKIQEIIDLNTLTAAGLYVKQLTYEFINFCDTSKITEHMKLQSVFVECSEALDKSVNVILSAQPDIDAGEFRNLHEELLRQQLKSHRLIHRVKGASSVGINILNVLQQIDYCLDKIILQLETKSKELSFRSEKLGLKNLHKFVVEIMYSENLKLCQTQQK